LDSLVRSFHIELTSKCVLSCPRCTRTLNRGQYFVGDLPFNLIQRRFHPGILADLEEVLFCGAHGDPIYHDEFHSVIKHFKQNPPLKVVIITIGSHRAREWWEDLAEILTINDCVKFSIDGLEDTNSLYRKNSRWKNIMTAVEVLKGRVYLEWKFIVFKHNQHQISQAQQMAGELGFNSFELIRSSTFDGHFIPKGETVDPLKPDPEFVAMSSAISNSNKITPVCLNGRYHFITASGHYLPCCWAGNFPNYNEPLFQKYQEQRDLSKYTLEEILSGSGLKKLRQSWSSSSTSPKVCQQTCNKPIIGKHNDALFEIEKTALAKSL
jgi:hypothetical protein